MEITENTFIDILGLPEWNDRVLDLTIWQNYKSYVLSFLTSLTNFLEETLKCKKI